MDYSHILVSGIFEKQKAFEYGFSESREETGELILKSPLMQGEFYALIKLSEKSFTAQVFESFNDEKYALFEHPSARGAFVGQIRDEVNILINDIREKCFISKDLHLRYYEYIKEHFGTEGDLPWEDLGALEYRVFRCPNKKWFALVMEVKYKNLDFDRVLSQEGREEKVMIVNLKADSEKIPELVDRKSIFPSYHMNKKYWISVLLTSITDFEKLKSLTERSYDLVFKKKS